MIHAGIMLAIALAGASMYAAEENSDESRMPKPDQMVFSPLQKTIRKKQPLSRKKPSIFLNTPQICHHLNRIQHGLDNHQKSKRSQGLPIDAIVCYSSELQQPESDEILPYTQAYLNCVREDLEEAGFIPPSLENIEKLPLPSASLLAPQQPQSK